MTSPDMPEKPFGLDDEELIDYPTVFEDGLFKDKTVIISGGGTGIGRGIAYLFARLGANVVICGRKIETLTETADGIRNGLGIEITTHVMSIREPDEVTGLFDMVWDKFGGLDLLINNGGGQFPQDAIDNSINGWNAVIDTNLNGTWYMMQTAARRWRDAEKPGNIINIVVNIARGTRQTTHTCAARAGVIYLSKSVAVEWAPLDIRVNCVSPGAISSYGFRVYPPEAMAKFKDSNPMRRTGNVWDIAEACAYLGAPSSNFITGEVLTVDGGNQMWGESWAFGEPEYFIKGRGGAE